MDFWLTFNIVGVVFISFQIPGRKDEHTTTTLLTDTLVNGGSKALMRSLRASGVPLARVQQPCPHTGRMLLHLAVLLGKTDVVRTLISRKFSNEQTGKMAGLDVNETDMWGDTPLVIAAAHGHVRVRGGVSCVISLIYKLGYSVFFLTFLEN